ncbi:MAG TPA: SusC/RagA family TonB-linked outer membrane protein [Longimicrobiales bacterium]
MTGKLSVSMDRRARRLIPLALLAMFGAGAAPAWAQTGTVRGQVVDAETRRPIAGVQVLIPGTSSGALTDDRGMYVLVNVAAGPVTVRAMSLGYATAEQVVTVVAGETAVADFSLTQAAITLDEVVVTATGEARKREIGNSVSTVNATEIAAPSLRGTQEVLAGRAAGVTVLSNSGQPGAGGTIRIRGNNSVTQGNNPIIYVDGVRIHNGSTPTNVYARQAASPLQDINPADIERIEVVKGPAATTLYGTEASGGVIQIFTKRGRPGAARWTLELAGGFNNMGHVGPESDPTGLFINQCRGENLVAGDGERFEDPTCPSNGTWLRNGPIQRYSLSVRGGDDNLSYYASGHFSDEEGVLPTSESTDGGFRTTLTFRPAESIGFTASTSYTKRNTHWVPDGNNASGFMLNVTRGPGSNFKGGGCSDATVTCVRNGDIFTSTSTTATDHYIAGLTITHTPRDNISNRLSVGFDYNRAIIETINPFGFPRTPTGQYYWQDWNQTLLTVDFASSLQNEFGESFASTFSWGGQLFDSRLARTAVEARDFSGPGKPTLTSAAIREVTDDTRQRVVNAGFFVQEMLGWRDRLFVTAGLRVDGNSAFGSDFGLQPYPKLSASYILSDHDFWPADVVETLKLRAAVGESGKAPGAFDAVRTWAPIAGDDGQPGYTPEQLGNPDLGPERTREVEVGFELGALGGRLGVDFTYYTQNTMDALIPVVYPPSNGFSNSQLENVGELKTSGFEVMVDAGLVRTEAVDWSARVNYTTVETEAVDLGGQVLTVAATARTYIKEGLPVPAYIGKKVLNPDEYADPIIEEDAFLGPAYPERLIGVSSSVTLYDRLTLDVLGEAQLGHYLMNALGYQNAAGNRRTWRPCWDAQAKMDAGQLDQVTALDRVRCSTDSGTRDYDYWIEPADFFKLRSVALSYQLPDGTIPGTRGATITVAGRNLLTVTDYSGTDPEVSDIRDSAFARRDYYNFPTSRSFLVSLRVNF